MATMPAAFEWNKVTKVDPETLSESGNVEEMVDMFVSVSNCPHFIASAKWQFS